jgi:hypothetical protein
MSGPPDMAFAESEARSEWRRIVPGTVVEVQSVDERSRTRRAIVFGFVAGKVPLLRLRFIDETQYRVADLTRCGRLGASHWTLSIGDCFAAREAWRRRPKKLDEPQRAIALAAASDKRVSPSNLDEALTLAAAGAVARDNGATREQARRIARAHLQKERGTRR